MDFDVLAFAGRFQPFHNGHKAVVDEALTHAKKVAIVIGSHDQPRDTRNPFTTAERIAMISAVYPEEVRMRRISFVPQIDYRYNDKRWAAGVRTGVMTVANTPFTPDPVRIGLIGHSKDQTSWYLKAFPEWDSIDVQNHAGIDATYIRHCFFNDLMDTRDAAMLPQAVMHWLDEWSSSQAFMDVRREIDFERRYKKPNRAATDAELDALVERHLPYGLWASGKNLISEFAQQFKSPYKRIDHTVDGVVIQSGHVLLVERGAMPGKGLWALPGGYVESDEWLEDAVLRELREETMIALSDETLRRCIREVRDFDDPNRSQRGRTITTAFLIELRDDVKLTKVKGSDDAAKARWVPLSEVKRSVMFEDHFDIISEMTGAV